MGKMKSSVRKLAEKISDAKVPNQFLGSHSSETIDQELYSLENTKPMFRDPKWHKQARNMRATILNKIAKGESKYQRTLSRLNSIEEMR